MRFDELSSYQKETLKESPKALISEYLNQTSNSLEDSVIDNIANHFAKTRCNNHYLDNPVNYPSQSLIQNEIDYLDKQILNSQQSSNPNLLFQNALMSSKDKEIHQSPSPHNGF
jgi:hypothetical protein